MFISIGFVGFDSLNKFWHKYFIFYLVDKSVFIWWYRIFCVFKTNRNFSSHPRKKKQFLRNRWKVFPMQIFFSDRKKNRRRRKNSVWRLISKNRFSIDRFRLLRPVAGSVVTLCIGLKVMVKGSEPTFYVRHWWQTVLVPNGAVKIKMISWIFIWWPKIYCPRVSAYLRGH